MQPADIPHRMYTSEVLALARISRATLRDRQRRGAFPRHIDRGKEFIFSGPEVYRALGIIKDSQDAVSESPWGRALEEMRTDAAKD